MDQVKDWLRRAEAQLDEWGRGAWIAAMVLGFIVVWPVGLALLFYMIWSGRMGCRSKHHRRGFQSSGNTAFDEYRAETLRRLEDEQSAFREFMAHLRRAKDKAEFDRFMDERRRTADPDTGAQPA